MSRQKGFSRSRAIQNALGRLGWHAKPAEVIAFLAEQGIEISEGLVQKVKLEAVKDTSRIRRQRAAIKPTLLPVVRVRKLAPGRASRGR